MDNWKAIHITSHLLVVNVSLLDGSQKPCVVSTTWERIKKPEETNSSFLDASYCAKSDMEVLSVNLACSRQMPQSVRSVCGKPDKLIRKDVSNFCTVEVK